MDWNEIRAQFPALQEWTYLNTATFGQVPKRSAEAVAKHFERRDRLASSDFLEWYDDADRLRKSIARLIGAEDSDIAFAGTAAHALSAVVAGLELAAGETIVTLKDEFPNQLYQGNVREVAWDDFYTSIDANVKLVAISEVNYATGFRPPLAEVTEFLKARGVPLYVDGTQSLGALEVDLRRTPVDVYAVHGYKWLISPAGAGFFYISPEFRKRLRPNIVGWRSHYDWRNVDRLHHGTPEFSDRAEKFEGGGLPNALLYAMEASVEMLLEIGAKEIERRVLELACEARTMLRGLGAEVADTGSQVVAARFPKSDVSEMARMLRKKKIVVAARHGALRVSPHFYNNKEDIAVLERGLGALM